VKKSASKNNSCKLKNIILMFSIWSFFLKKKEFTAALIVILIAAGIYCAFQIPKEAQPTIVIPIGTVTTTFPGASATDVESLITNPLEEAIINIGNIDTLNSTSVDGMSSIRVQFDANADLNQSIDDLRDAVSKTISQLPSDVNTPSVNQANYNDRPVLSVSVSGDLPQTELATIGQELTDDLEAVPGVSSVSVSGIPQKEVDVIVNKDSLSEYDLKLTDVISAIAASNVAQPSGSITMAGVNYDVDFQGNISDPSQLGDIAVANKNGATIYLRDVALVADGLAPASTYSRASVAGAPANQAMTLLVYKQSDADVSQVTTAVKTELTQLEPTLLSGLTVLIPPSTDQGIQVSEQLGELVKTGSETVILVIIILLITIGWRESLVAALSIPLSFLLTFIGLYISGNTLNLISMFALILAVGILVDSGIVITEAIHARIRVFGNATDAAVQSLHEYAWPLIAGTATTIVVFVPLMFLTGTVGKFISAIPYTLILVLIASIFVALGIVPLIATLFTKLHQNNFEKKQDVYTVKVRAWYVRHLKAFLLNRRAQNIFFVILGVLFIGAIALPITGVIPSSFFPQTNQDYVYVDLSMPPGESLAQTDLATREVEELLYTDKDIASFVTSVGSNSAFNGGGNTTSGSNQANITVNLQPGHTKSSTQIQADIAKLLAPIKNASIQVLQPSTGPGSGAPIQIQFTGTNLNDLIAAADSAQNMLTTIPGVSNITTTTKNNGTEFALTIDRAKATALGLTTSEVAQTLRAAINGTIATTIDEPLQNINVIVKLNLNTNYTDPSNTNETTIDAIKDLSIETPSGPVLLGSVLDDSLESSNASIAHLNEQRIETISAYPVGNVTVTTINAEFQSKLASLNLPSDVTVTYGGDQQSIIQSDEQLALCLFAGLLMMFMILVLTFNSVRSTLELLLIIPLSLIGGLGGLALTGQTLSFPALLGFIALGGVIINHAIILTDSMLRKSAAEPDKPKMDVVLDAAATRLRPIILTTVTTVIGMVPLAQDGGEWAPLAFTVMFGLGCAIILTLVLLPTLFYRNKDKKAKKSREEK